MAQHINEQDTLNDGRKKINESIDASERAESKSDQAVQTANTATDTSDRAETKADSVQAQFNEVVIEGDSSVEAAQARVDVNNNIHTTLKDRVDSDYLEVTEKIGTTQTDINQRSVNVKNFGAVGDGVSDDTEAFRQALSSGGVSVFIPKGIYKVDEIRIPSNSSLIGASKEETIIKLADSAPVTANLLSNKDYKEGNINISISNFTVDWNIEREGLVFPIQTGEPDGCGVIFINTKYLKITDIISINAGRHCFDVSANRYHKAGDDPSHYQEDGCSYVWIDNCEASGAGDDNFTTHFSSYIWIRGCTSTDPSGIHFAGNSVNSNCFEIDDGSSNVWVIDCYAKGGSRGFEAKAHNHSPAPYNVKFINCVAENNQRSFDIRHNGHGRSDEPTSISARDVDFVNCTSINPIITDGSLGPRALAIAGYIGVNVSNFTAIGGQDGITEEVISIYQKASNVNLNNINVRDFKNSSIDIRIVGGDNRPSNINLSNVSLYNSSNTGINIGTNINSLNISSVKALIDDREGTTALAIAGSSDVTTSGIETTGYRRKFSIGASIVGGNDTHRFKGATVFSSSTSSYATHDNGSVLSSTDYSVASGNKSIVSSSSSSESSGERSSVLSSSGSVSSGPYSSVISSRDSEASGARSSVLSSYGVINPQGNSIAGGYSTESTSTANRMWQINSANGNITAVGQIEGGGVFSDYAEYFESQDATRVPTGTMVTLVGSKIAIADRGDEVLGVISETAGTVLGSASFFWKDRFLRNEFGGIIYEKVRILDDKTNEYGYIEIPKENPEYIDQGDNYISRKERDEWNVVGLLGQVHTRIDSSVGIGDFIEPNKGVGTKSDKGLYVMDIVHEYNERKGYGVGLVFIK